MLKKMSEYTYHYGLMVRIYPNTEQKQIISVNSNVSRFVYNKMVQLGKEISSFGRPNIYLKVVSDRIAYLREIKDSTTKLKDIYPWLCDKRIDSLAIANAKLVPYLEKSIQNALNVINDDFTTYMEKSVRNAIELFAILDDEKERVC